MFSNENIKKVDPAIAEVLDKELERQNSHIELIASENWVNDAILEAAGSILRACLYTILPACVRVTLLLVLTKSEVFSSDSSACI